MADEDESPTVLVYDPPSVLVTELTLLCKAQATLTTGISTSTAWGVSTSRAAGDSESLARSPQRLPVTAMIVSHGAGQDRRVLLADANPAIGALPVATLDPVAESPASIESTGSAETDSEVPREVPNCEERDPDPGSRPPRPGSRLVKMTTHGYPCVVPDRAFVRFSLNSMR